MNHTMQRKTRISILLAALLLLAVAVTRPARALAAQPVPAGGVINVPGLYDISTTNEQEVEVTVNGVALTGINKSLTVMISNITLTLMDAHITGSDQGAAICSSGKDAGLILVGENSATGRQNYAGVFVPTIAAILIEGPGKLTATGANGGAGIGGNGWDFQQ